MYKTFKKLRYFVVKYKIVTYFSLIALTFSNFKLRQDNKDLFTLVTSLKIEVQHLIQENYNVKDNLIIYNRNFESFPLPTWQKLKRGDKYISQYVNPCFMEDFGHLFDYDRFGYIGKTDEEIYPPKIAERIKNSDRRVAKTGKQEIRRESYFNHNGELKRLRVLKWRQIQYKDTLIYGMILKTKF